jgi:hypothetical protein
MAKYVLALILLLGVMAGASYAQVCPGISGIMRPKGFQALTVSTTAVGFTIPSGSEMAITYQELADVRWRDDGTAPTSAVGILSTNGNQMIVCPGSLSLIKFIRTAGVDATISTVFYGR